MKVTNNNGLISITEMTVTEAEVLMIAILNGAEARKSCEEPSRILRRLGMVLDTVIPNQDVYSDAKTKTEPTQSEG